MNKGNVQNFFDDFELNQEFTCPVPRVATDGDRAIYIALTGDRTPRFCNAQGLVHPLIVFHMIMGQTVRQISLNARANLGYAQMIWRTPVHVGDELHTVVNIIGLKENSNRKTGIVYVRTTGMNHRNDIVLEYVRWVMVKKNRENVTPYLEQPVIPQLGNSVEPSLLTMHSPDQFDVRATGGRFFYEDYHTGERILHIDGTTVNASDHMSFTRLYQNTAKVHFDARLTKGNPLVYGGFPMSLGYAQAFNGLENRLGIAAINGGSHSNPVHSGDTLYSFTDVIDRADVGPHFGALRLRLIVVKNEEPSEEFPIMKNDPVKKREVYHPNVVLDLDYWEMVAKKELA